MAGPNISEMLKSSGFSLDGLTNITPSEYFELIKPLVFFIVGITIYSLFIFHFYRFLARRDVLGLELTKTPHNFMGFLKKMITLMFYTVENLVLTPLFVFFWFFVLVALITLLTRNPSANDILITSVALVAAIRISAYYNENLSQDLAKMIPFALLGIFLVDASFFSIEGSISVAKQLPNTWRLLVYYLVFVTSLEFVLRICHGVYSLLYARLKPSESNNPKVKKKVVKRGVGRG